MPTTAGTLITDVLDRIRDPNAQMVATDTPPTTASGTAFMLTMLTIGQQFAARATRQPVSTFTLATSSGTVLYDMTSVGPSDWMGRMVGLTDSTSKNEIDGPVDWKALGRASRTWFVDTTANLALSWAQIGLTLVAVWPSNTINYTLHYLPLLATLTTTGQNMQLPDPFVEQAAEITELICRIKTRQLTNFDNRLKELKDALGVVDKLAETGGMAL